MERVVFPADEIEIGQPVDVYHHRGLGQAEVHHRNKALPAGEDRSEPVLAALGRVDRSEVAKYLPLLGRLGGR